MGNAEVTMLNLDCVGRNIEVTRYSPFWSTMKVGVVMGIKSLRGQILLFVSDNQRSQCRAIKEFMRGQNDSVREKAE